MVSEKFILLEYCFEYQVMWLLSKVSWPCDGMKKILSNYCPHGQQSSCALSIPVVSSPVVLYQSPWSAVQLCFINPHGQQSSCALSIPIVSSPVVLYQSPWSAVQVVLYQSPWSAVQLCFINPHSQQSSCALSIPIVSSPVVLYQSP